MPNGSDGYANVVNGKIYVISGANDPNINLNQVYDPATDSWTTKTPMPNPTGGYNDGSAVLDNKIYVVGSSDSGLTHNLLQIYDPATDTWSVGSPPPVFMGGNIGAVAATTGAYAPKRIYVIGVTTYADQYGNATNVNQIYDPATNSWVIGASMPTSRQDFGAAVINDKIYAIGGSVTYYQFPDDNYGVSVIYYAANELYIPIGYGTPDPSYVLTHTPPATTLLSPLSQTYNQSSISLVFTVNKAVNWTEYSLDGKQNVTLTGNTTLTELPSGLHNITIYANDTYGNIGASQTINFTISLSQPFPTATVAAVSVSVVVVIVAGALVYFKKCKLTTHSIIGGQTF
jgi:N-acetylneuraminic acid mutarotase